jgi:hypothetical protein
MALIDILSLILSLGIIFSLRLFFPRNVVPLVSTSFEEAMALLEHAEAIDIPRVSEFRANLAMYACLHPLAVRLQTDLVPRHSLRPQFIQMRTESHRSPFFFQQVYLLLLCGLTWRLYVLKSRVDAVRRTIEVCGGVN